MKFAVMREAPTFISIMKDARKCCELINFFLSKVLFKRLQRRVLFAPCMFGAIPDIPFSNKYVMKDKKPMVTVNV